MGHTELKEYHLKPATFWGELIRNQVGKLVNRANLNIEGLNNVESLKSGAIIVVAPHNGHVDTALVRMAFNKEARKLMFAMAAGDYWERIGWKQLASSVARTFPVSRKSGGQALHDLEQIAALVTAGERVVIFPEGTRSREDKPMSERRFKTGLGLLVLMTEGKVPIIPVYLEGSEKLMPPGEILPQFKKGGQPHPVTVRIGEQIDLSSYVKKPIEEMGRDDIKRERKMITSFIRAFFLAQEMKMTEAKEGVEPY